ncbi:MAG: protein kinase [Planctomycetes bacterium]|nr:protein kinase [Planctomycetota bacterium]
MSNLPSHRIGALAAEFEILGELGRGGMGTVYRARDRSGRLVALKIIEDASPAARRRLLDREGTLTAALSHPGIVKVHAAGEAGRIAYLVYELVEGCRPLRVEPGVEGGREVFLERIKEVAEAVGFAHSHGIVHRDLKPDNVLVDREGLVRVADLGVAWAQTAERLTRSDAIIGTPHYMAPEAFRGEVHGPPLDVYSLGVMLYEGLTGTLPVNGGNLYEVAVAASSGDVVPASKLDATVWPKLNGVVMRALALDPGDRYPDGGALAEALAEALSGSRRRSIAGPALRILALVIGLLGVLTIGSVISLGPTPRLDEALEAPLVEPPRRRALTAAEVLKGDRALRNVALIEAADVRSARVTNWLESYPGHPKGAEARALLAVAERVVPRFEVHHPLVEGKGIGRTWIAWLGEGRFLSSQRRGPPQLCLWVGTELVRATNLEFVISCLSADQRSIACVNTSTVDYVPDLNHPTVARRTPLGGTLPKDAFAEFVPGTATIVVALSDGAIAMVDLEQGRVLRRLETQGGVVQCLDVSADGRWLGVGVGVFEAGSGDSVAVQLWDLGSGELADAVQRYSVPIVAFSEDASLVAIGGRRELQLFRRVGRRLVSEGYFEGANVEGLQDNRALSGFGNPAATENSVKRLAFWAGRLFSFGNHLKGPGGTLRVYGVKTRRELYSVPVHERVEGMHVSARGWLVLLADGTIRAYSSE